MTIAVAVAKWLLGLRHIATAIPVTVRIGKHVFPGAKYIEDRDGVSEDRLYLVGEFPASYRRSHKICYRTADSDRDWYIVAWFLKNGENVEYHECHRFGSHFILAEWSMSQGWTIDTQEVAVRFR